MSDLLPSVSYLFQRWVLRRRYLDCWTHPHRLRFRILAEDGIGRTIFKHGGIDEEYLSVILKIPFRDGDVVLDVGANIGWYATVLDLEVKAAIVVFAFEPEPLNFGLLRHNVETNRAAKVTPVQKAVGDVDGTAKLFLYHPKNSGRHSLLDVNLGDARSIEVPAVTLDRFLEDGGVDPARVAFVKMDIEGFEDHAFRGAERLLRHVPYVLFEIVPPFIPPERRTPMVELLARNDYRFFVFRGKGPEEAAAADVARDERVQNVLLVKKGAPLPG